MLILTMMMGCIDGSGQAIMNDARATGISNTAQCDGPMISLDPTFLQFITIPDLQPPDDVDSSAWVDMFGDSHIDINFTAITNHCDQDLSLLLELSYDEGPDLPYGEESDGTSVGGFSLEYYPESDNGARGSAGGVSGIAVTLPAHETDVRGVTYTADTIVLETDPVTGEITTASEVPPLISYDYGWLDVTVMDVNNEATFHAEAALEATVMNMWLTILGSLERNEETTDEEIPVE